MRERRVGEGEREEMRGDDRRGGALGVRRHAQQHGHTPTRASTCYSLRAGMRRTGQPTGSEGWARR